MNLAILIPIYRDWKSFWQLHAAISNITQVAQLNVHIFAVNDDSSDFQDTESVRKQPTGGVPVSIIQLVQNLGHQRAIVAGLTTLNTDEKKFHAICVMDADGEDRAEDLILLVDQLKKQPGKIIFVQRGKRSEGLVFKVGYWCYLRIYRLLTGHSEYYGNFCVFPTDFLKDILHISEIWNHFSGGILQAKIPHSFVIADRGKRFFGKSSMKYFDLIVHGINAIAAYRSQVAIRVLFASFILFGLSVLGLAAVLLVKFFTSQAIPGWASTMVLGLGSIGLQCLLTSTLLLFLVSMQRSQPPFIPASDAKKFIRKA